MEYNLEIAKRLGATYPIQTSKVDAFETILKKTNGDGVDHVFIAVGIQAVLNDSFRIVKRGGKVSEVALFGKKPEIEISYLQNKEIQIIGSNMYTRDDFEIAADAMQLACLIPHCLFQRYYPSKRPRLV
ncbi:zinc-binding dehydrogenase [[Brevibacterium] frigoritolerans]|nr:zinc-binding dehydrogenase [Peribacillus frigoritolerans]